MRILIPGLVALLALGLLAGVGVAAPQFAADSTEPATTAADTTATDTTAAETTATDPTATETTATETTATETTATETTATDTTDTTATETTATDPAVTATTTIEQTTPVTTSTTPTDAGQTTAQSETTPAAPSPPPVAPCDTTAITCGNNASTQVAIVSQTCTAVQQNSVLSVDIQTLDGKPVSNFTLNNNTTCLNTLSITQVVQQLCVGCTVVIVPPPTVQNVITQVFVTNPPPAPLRVGYCMPYPVKRGDGTYSTLVTLDDGQPDWDPAYAAATKASFDPQHGFSCPTPIDAAKIPTFTLTVPMSFVGQMLRLCLQPASPKASPYCHDVQIDNGATITVPVTQSLTAAVVPKKVAPAKSAKKIKAASRLYTSAAVTKTHPKHRTKKRSHG